MTSFKPLLLNAILVRLPSFVLLTFLLPLLGLLAAPFIALIIC